MELIGEEEPKKLIGKLLLQAAITIDDRKDVDLLDSKELIN